MALDGQGAFEEVGVVFLQPSDLGLLRRRTKEAGAFQRDRQASGGDDLLAARALVAPFNEGIPVVISVVLGVAVAAAVSRAGIEADRLEDLVAPRPAPPR